MREQCPKKAEQLRLPSGYGSPDRLLDWASVEQRLIDSLHYWLATIRRDGSPHVVPMDGIWHDDGCYFGGDPVSVHVRNMRRDGGRGVAAAASQGARLEHPVHRRDPIPIRLKT
jgi:Pyridoxamine 5'-phosphate oxidase